MKTATVHSRAHELLKHSKIRVRLQQPQDETRHNNQITVDEIARGLRRAIAGAEESGQWSAAVAASVGHPKRKVRRASKDVSNYVAQVPLRGGLAVPTP